MRKGFHPTVFALLIAGVVLQGGNILNDSPDARGISKVQSRNQGQTYLQSTDPSSGANILIEKGNKYVVDRDSKSGLADWYPTPPPNFVTGVTPMHLTYQYLTTPQHITTPLNQFAFPRVHVPIYGLEHPMNMHHPYNNIFGMHPQMYTGAASAQPHLFLNPAGYGKMLMQPGAAQPILNGMGAASPLAAGLQAQPGFNPAMTGVGPFGGGMGAFNPSQSPMGSWFYLSPFNSGE